MKKKTEIDLSIPDSFENVLKAVVRPLDEEELTQLKKETRAEKIDEIVSCLEDTQER